MKTMMAAWILCFALYAPAQNGTTVPQLSPAEQSMATARREIEKKPDQFAGYNHLAIALSRRARESSDISSYTQAEEALKKSLELAPGNIESEKIHVWLMLGRHEFPAALDAAKALNKKNPDDILVLWFSDRCQCGTGAIRRGRGVCAMDVKPACRESAGNHASRIPSRVVW